MSRNCSLAGAILSIPTVGLCEQEPVRIFQNGAPTDQATLRRWWTYLSHLRLSVHHIQGTKNNSAHYITRND